MANSSKKKRVCKCGCERSLKGTHGNRRIALECEKKVDKQRRKDKKENDKQIIEIARRATARQYIIDHPTFWKALKRNAFIELNKSSKKISIGRILGKTGIETGISPSHNLRKYFREMLEENKRLKNAFRVRGHRATK